MKISIEAALLVLMSVAGFSACDVRRINDATDDDDASGSATVAESFSFQVEVANQTRIEVLGVNGPIDVVGSPGATRAEIWGERRVTSQSTEDARSYLNQLQVQVSAAGASNIILVKTVQPSQTHGRDLEVVYHLRIPARLEAFVDNINGSVRLDSVAGQVGVELINGTVRINEVSGNTSVHLTNGNVYLATSSGSMETSVAVVNGNIDAGLPMPLQALCELHTVNGTIALRIPQNTSAQFSAGVTSGTISLTGLSLQNANTTPTSMSGRLGNGDGRIKLGTVNGSIHVDGF
jgi:hypothetical protein